VGRGSGGATARLSAIQPQPGLCSCMQRSPWHTLL
jgi:hypothetical protein